MLTPRHIHYFLSMAEFQNDPEAGILHEGPIGAAPLTSGDVDLGEFANLSALAAEFVVIDRFTLPFRTMNEDDVRFLYATLNKVYKGTAFDSSQGKLNFTIQK